VKKKNIVLRILGNEKAQPYTVPIYAVICSLIASSLLLWAIGKDPILTFVSFLRGSGILSKPNYLNGINNFTDLSKMLSNMTPMVFAALGVCVAFKTGLFNIGVSGQMLLSGFIATVAVGYSDLPAAAAIPLILLIGIAVGGFVGMLIGLLKAHFNINEVVTSIMFNYIISYTVAYFINTKYLDMINRVSLKIKPQTSLVLQDIKIAGISIWIPTCLVLAIICAFLLRFFLNKTKTGLELRAVGQNKKAARYFGISTKYATVLSMTISGAFGGLAGVTLYLGYNQFIVPKDLSSMGFDAIAVSLLGNSNPIGCVVASLFVTIISFGTTYATTTIGVKREIAQLITGLILLFAACGTFIRYLLNRNAARSDEPHTAPVPAPETVLTAEPDNETEKEDSRNG